MSSCYVFVGGVKSSQETEMETDVASPKDQGVGLSYLWNLSQ